MRETIPELSIPLSYSARQSWHREMSFEDYVAGLLARGLLVDAVRLLAAVLSPRELVWWSALCVWAAHGRALSDAEHYSMTATVHWVRNPTGHNYTRAVEAYRRCRPDSATYGIGAAVYYFGCAAEESGKLQSLDPLMGVKCAQSAIFESVGAGRYSQPDQLAAIGMMLLRTPEHWKPK